MASIPTKRSEKPRPTPQDEALARRLYQTCQRLAPIEPALAWAGTLTPWEALPVWSRRLLATSCTPGIQPYPPGTTLDEEIVAESRQLVDEWIAIESDDVEVLREELVSRIAARLHDREAWIARLAAALAPRTDR
jgi:hypothetical protein